DLLANPHNFVDGKFLARIQPILKRYSRYVLHDQKRYSTNLADGKDRDDVFMAYGRSVARLLSETLVSHRGIRIPRDQKFQGHVSRQARVMSSEDDSHRSL